MKKILIAVAILLVIGVFYLYWHGSDQTQIQSTMQKIESQIAPITGDKLDIYIPTKPFSNIPQQISTNQFIPDQFKPYLSTLFLGTDSHGNLLIQNQSKIINSSTLDPNATAYLKSHPNIFANTQNVSSVGYGYGSVSKGTASLNPISTDSVHAGQTYHLFGKLYLYDKSRCKIITQNGERSTQCPTIIGPYQFRIQIQCVDSNEYRCNNLHDKLPTSHQESNPDGSFEYNFQTLTDPYYIGNYNAHFWVESESLVNGQTVTDEFDHPFAVLS